MAGGERVDARFVVHHIDRRHRNAGGQCHFLEDVQQTAFGQIGGLRIDDAPAKHQGDMLAAGRKLGDLVEAAQSDDRQRAGCNAEQQRRLPQRRRRDAGRAMLAGDADG